MKIFIINPNCDRKMTAAIQKAAENFSRGEFEVICRPTPGAPKFIETYEDQIKAAPGMIRLVRENHEKFDAFVVACHCDPQLDVLKEISRRPVVGIGEASIKLASMLGHRFSILSTDEHAVPSKEELVRKYHLQDLLASIKIPARNKKNASEEERYVHAAREAVEEDRAEVIVLGCAGLAGLDKRIQKKIGVPVLDGVACALIIASGLVKYGVSTSKKRRYHPGYGSWRGGLS